MIAPLIKPIRVQGGTFYTFSSAAEDLGFSFNSSNRKFRFSKYALLNIPDLRNPNTVAGTLENTIQLNTIPGAFNQVDGSKTLNDYLAESFQNYCLNLEAGITSSDWYDPALDRTVSERVFFKWLKEMGAIRFRQANPTELTSPTFGQRYVEQDPSLAYSKVVRQIGDINVVNSVQNKENAYSEVYIHIPSSQGDTPTVLFDSIVDNNYYPNAEITNLPVNPLAAEYLFGRDANTVSPSNLSTLAYYDSDTGTFTVNDPAGALGTYYYYDPLQGIFVPPINPGFKWWFQNPIPNTYFLEPGSFGDPSDNLFRIQSVNYTVDFLRSRLDGISLEFNADAYTDIANDPKVNNFGEYAEVSYSNTFDFNAVLVYYDLYDPNMPTSTTSNLFGVLFLDNVDPLPGNGGYNPRLTKYKPNPITGNSGNSYAFKINLKFDVNADDSSVQVTINDYNTFSLELYVDALNQLIAATKILEENQYAVETLRQQVTELENLIMTSTQASELTSRLDTIDQKIADSQLVFANNQNLLDLISRNYQEITNIYKGLTSVQMSYNVDLLKEGPGIQLDKSTPGQVIVINRRQSFTLGTKPLVYVIGDFSLQPTSYQYTHTLKEFSNYLKVMDGSVGNPLVVDRDVILYIDDTIQKWQAGQTMRITFKNGLDLSNSNGNFNFVIFTDATDSLNTGFAYSAEVGYIPYSEFDIRDQRPTIEIVCIDPATYTFQVDIY